ncbi:MAG TPA: hypothetical protein VK607_02665, partial [Kofleriaceae bacterium]|nr:hypothetical protein [Kofleriaceae bacterium]
MPTIAHWKNNIDDLRSMALAVDVSPPDAVTARGAARCLLGVVRLVADRCGPDVMQRACADLARHEQSWSSGLRTLPVPFGVNAAPIVYAMELLAAA